MPNDKLLQEAYLAIQKLSGELKREKERASAKVGMIEEDRKGLLTEISKDILRVLRPLLDRIADNSKVNGEDIKKAIEKADLKVTIDQEKPVVNVNVPDVIVPDIKVPTPIVNYTPPAINIPKMEMPEEMNIKGWVSLMGVSLEKPLPVQLRDAKGNPVTFPDSSTIIQGGGGASHGIIKVSQVFDSALGSLINADGRLKVETNDSGSSTTIVNQVSGAIWSVNIAQQDVSQIVNQVSGASWSVVATATDLDIRDLDFVTDDVSVYQVSGASWSVHAALDSTNATSLYNADNRLRVSVETGGSGLTDSELRATAVPVSQVSGANWSVSVTDISATNFDIRDLDNATDSVRAYQLSGAIYSTQGNLVARTTNPTATSDATAVLASADDLGRTLTRPIQVRDLISTAYATLSNGTETTLLAGVAGAYLDLVYIMAANTSNSAIQVDVRAVTAGNVMFTLEVPASGTAGVSLPVPIPQDATGNNWTVDMGDFSNTTLYVSALFSKEV